MRFIFIFLLFCTITLKAQVNEGFSDADFKNNPTWVGDTADFTVVNGQLRSNSNKSSYGFYISTPSTTANNAQWQFYVNLKLQTSSANYTDIYLMSDSANLKSANNRGYFVRIGNTTDEISLYKRSKGVNTKIIDGLDAEVSSSNNTIWVKVTRNPSNLWTLKTNLLGEGFVYSTEGTVTDSSITTSNYFGIFVQQSTIAFHYNHYFDDIYVGTIITDTIAPFIVSSTVISNTELDVLFDDYVDLSTSETLSNYTVNNGLGNPILAKRDVKNFRLLHLTFANTFPDGMHNTLNVTNINDLNKNSCGTVTSTFTYNLPVTAVFKDVIINEIFADPSPKIGLPDAEFIEIYNNSKKELDLTGWKLTDGSTIATLTSYTLSAGAYLIICNKGDTVLYKPFGNVLGVSSFPSLNNAGDHIYLKKATSDIIDSISYSDTWYQDDIKKQGGWSLELINPNENINCPVSNYWIASNNSIGGTPGKINSTYSLADTTAPKLLSAVAVSNTIIQLKFSEYMDMTAATNIAAYSIDNGAGNPTHINTVADDNKSVQLILTTPLKSGIDYTLALANSVVDCAGNSVGQNNTAGFIIPEIATANDIVINEILADPNTNGFDFVEIYNRSNKVIDLKTITLSQYDTINNVLVSIEHITTETYLMRPMHYVLLSENSAAVKSQYTTNNPNGFLDMKSMPTMSPASGTVCLANTAGIIDLFRYDEKMHFTLLTATKGVSLERIDFDCPTQDKSNWHSAAEAIGFATPGYKNSEYNKAGETDNAIEIKPDIFSPDEDGLNDIVNINYHFETSGLMANVTIYDSKGRSVKQLIKNELLGTIGTFTWDGIDENREKAKIGIYIFFVEAIDLTGKVKHYKKTCVLAGKL